MSSATYGILAEFPSSDALLEATRHMRQHAAYVLEAYTPYPVEGLPELLGVERNRVPLFTLMGGLAGGVGGYFMQWYASVISYPINVGGRPLHSWPLFVPVSFELTILCAAFAAVFALLIGNGLPRLRHPLFGVPDFDLASRNRFFLCVRSGSDPYDPQKIRSQLADLDAVKIIEVPL